MIRVSHSCTTSSLVLVCTIRCFMCQNVSQAGASHFLASRSTCLNYEPPNNNNNKNNSNSINNNNNSNSSNNGNSNSNNNNNNRTFCLFSAQTPHFCRLLLHMYQLVQITVVEQNISPSSRRVSMIPTIQVIDRPWWGSHAPP